MKGKLLWIIIAMLVVMLLAGGGAAYWLLRFQKSAQAAVQPVPKKVFVSLNPFVVSIQVPDKMGGPAAVTYLQIGFQFAAVHKRDVEAFKDLQPAIRGNVLALLLDLPPAILQQSKLRDQLKEKVLAEVNKTLANNRPELGKQAFTKVYITRFVTQAG